MTEIPRVEESQMLLEKMMNRAMGLYIAKEPKHADEWRDKNIWQNFMHLKHETEEIERSKTVDRQLHNALDACAQAAILAASIYIKMQEKDVEKAMKHSGDL